MGRIIFKFFKDLMEKKFNENIEKYGESWKYIPLKRMEFYLVEHIGKYFSQSTTILSYEDKINNLVDIANYCMMLVTSMQLELGVDIK